MGNNAVVKWYVSIECAGADKVGPCHAFNIFINTDVVYMKMKHTYNLGAIYSMKLRNTFGKTLRQFALSVDIVDQQRLTTILDMTREYLMTTLDIETLEYLSLTTVQGDQGLAPQWSANLYGPYRIYDEAGEPHGHAALSFHTNRPVCIVPAEENMDLHGAEQYVDLWSNMSEIPPYLELTNLPVVTHICIPVKVGILTEGVIYLESRMRLQLTDIIAEEMLAIANSLATIFDLKRSHDRRLNNTDQALKVLSSLKNTKIDFATPKVFLAYSNRAPKDVMTILMRKLDDYEPHVEVIDWTKISTTGEINVQVRQAIRSSKYGICFFSEPSEDDSLQFDDNPNVLIEAGMFHGREDDPTKLVYLPIRETNSAKDLPFDLASVRILFAERDETGNLNEEKLSAELDKYLETLFQEEVESGML